MLRYLKKSGFSGQLLVAVLGLTFSLMIASPVFANDNGPHAWVTGDFEWYFPGCPSIPSPPLSGHMIISLKVPRDGNPAEVSGWIYYYRATDDFWIIVIPIKKVEWPLGVTPIPLLKIFDQPRLWRVGCPGDWVGVEGKVVVGAFKIVSSSDRSKVGWYSYGVGLDGGPGGADYFHLFKLTEFKHETLSMYYPNYLGFPWPPIFSNVIEGDLVIE